MTTLAAPAEEAPPRPAPEHRARPARNNRALAAFIAAGATTLSTVAVASVVAGARWQVHAFGSIALVLVVGVVARAARLPRPAVIAAQLASCVGYVTALYAGKVAVWGFVPGPGATERLRDRVDEAFVVMESATPPFTADNNVGLILVVGVAATAIAVDALFTGYRRPLLAGVPLLVLYTIPALTLPDGPRTWLFALPALALLLLLVGDDRERLARWGLMPDRADLARSGARRTGVLIGVIVLAISLVVPWIVPNVSGRLFEDHGIGQKVDPPITMLDPLVEMRRELVRAADVDVLEVTSDSARPEELYLRAVTLDEFTGTQWRAGDRSIAKFAADLPPVPGLSPAVAASFVGSAIRGLPKFRADYLPLPYPSTRLQIEGEWRVDPLTSNVASARGREQAAGLLYSVTSLDLDPVRADVGDTAPSDPYLERYLELPKLPQRITDTAKKVTDGARGPLEIGLKLQSWMRNPKNFTYDLRTPQGSGSNALIDFLNRRRGYCEQFAATMAVMARALGVPARVNVGYTAGEEGGAGRLISAHDAHAWPELYLPNIGWTRFEPTPGTASSGPTVPQWLQDAAPEKNPDDGKGDEPEAEPPPPPPDAGSSGDIGGDDPACIAGGAGCEVLDVSTPPVLADDPDDPNTLVTILKWIGLFLLLLLVLLAAPGLIRAEQRRRRWALMAGGRGLPPAGTPAAAAVIAEVAWAELRDTTIDLGYAWPVARTPRQAAATLTVDGHLRDQSAVALTEITALVERARYSAAGGDAVDGAHVRSSVEAVGAGLAETAGRGERWFARLAPRSLRTSVFRPARARMTARLRSASRRVSRRAA